MTRRASSNPSWSLPSFSRALARASSSFGESGASERACSGERYADENCFPERLPLDGPG